MQQQKLVNAEAIIIARLYRMSDGRRFLFRASLLCKASKQPNQTGGVLAAT